MIARRLDGVATAAAIRAELVPEVAAFKSAAGGHAIGNSNLVKAEVLASYLEQQVLPPLLPTFAPGGATAGKPAAL